MNSINMSPFLSSRFSTCVRQEANGFTAACSFISVVFEGPVKRPEKDQDRTEFNRKKTGNLMDRSRP
jgi:hypothetical protein